MNQSQDKKLHPLQTATAYKLYKDNAFVGYLIGSRHLNINPQEYDELKNSLNPLIEDCSNIFFECNLPASVHMPFGYEKAALELLETQFTEKKQCHFEPIILQHALLNSSVWIGTKIKFLPWQSYKTLAKAPKLYFYLSKITLPFVKIYNTLYNLFTSNKHTQALVKKSQNDQKTEINRYKAFKKGISLPFNKLEGQIFLMEERNKLYVNKMVKHETNQTALYMVGAGHLPSTMKKDESSNNDGMVYLLEKAGYKLEPINFIN